MFYVERGENQTVISNYANAGNYSIWRFVLCHISWYFMTLTIYFMFYVERGENQKVRSNYANAGFKLCPGGI
jgi:hypothetical protein